MTDEQYRQEILDALKIEPRPRSYFSNRSRAVQRALEDEGVIVASQEAGNKPKMLALAPVQDFEATDIDRQVERALKAGPSDLLGLGLLPAVLVERLHVLQVCGFVRHEAGLWVWVGASLAVAVVSEERDLLNKPIKTCPKCIKERPTSEVTHAYTELEADVLFGPHTATKVRGDGTQAKGWQSWCRRCRKEKAAASYEASKKQLDFIKSYNKKVKK